MELASLSAASVSRELAMHAADLHQLCFSPGWNTDTFQKLLDTPGVNLILARASHDNGQLTGLLLARAIAGEAEILTICVNPEFRGQGLGTRLVQRMIRDLVQQGTREFFLEVAENNSPALGLYRRCGFQILGQRKAYYADGQNAVTMRRADMI